MARIERVFDDRLEDFLRRAKSDLGMLSGKNQALSRLELVFNELEGIGLGGAISRFLVRQA